MLFLLRYVPQKYLLPTCFLFWLLWLFIGSVFFTVNGDYHWPQGFYMAVNVGYSVGWGFPGDMDIAALWFATIYVMIGVVAVAGVIGLFTDSVIEGRKNWVKKALERKDQQLHPQNRSYIRIIISFLFENYPSYVSIIAWFLWIIVGVVWSLETIEWSFSEAVYFAVSSLSTGGLWPIPEDSSSEKYGFVAFYAAVGIPMMGRAAGDLAAMFLANSANEEEILDSILQPLSNDDEEFIRGLRSKNNGMMQEEGKDNFCSDAEFVLVCLRRTEGVDPALIEYIYDQHRKRSNDQDPNKSSVSSKVDKHHVQNDTGGGVDDSGLEIREVNPGVAYQEVPSEL